MSEPTLPAGVRRRKNRYVWRPTTLAERLLREMQGLPESVTIGMVGHEDDMRRVWAEVTGRRPPLEQGPAAGTIAEILERYEREQIPRRAPKTQVEYKRAVRVLLAEFGGRRYPRDATELSSAQRLRTLDVQRFLDRATAPVSANRTIAVLSDAFAWAIRWGLTSVNPASGARRHAERPRDREVKPWEIEALRAHAQGVMAMWLEWALMTAWREGDMLRLQRGQLEAAGIRLRQAKRGKRQLWEWTPELRDLVDRALAQPGAARSLYVFAQDDGTPYTVWALQSAWRRLLARTNAALTSDGLPSIVDLHFHDLRADAIAEADAQGQDGQVFAGHADSRITDRVYRRRTAKVTPLRR